MTEQELFTQYPVLKHASVDFLRSQILEAIEKAKIVGKKELLQSLKSKPVVVNRKGVKGKLPEYYLSPSFIDSMINTL